MSRSVVSVRYDCIATEVICSAGPGLFYVIQRCTTLKKLATHCRRNCPELERFIQAEAHIRAAARISDALTVIKPPHLSKEQLDGFHNLASEVTDMLWEASRHVQDLLSAYFIPVFPI